MLRTDSEGVRRKLVFAIHDLHPWGGQDRSTLEIIKRLQAFFLIEIYAYCVEGFEPSEQIQIHRVRPYFRRPILLKSMVYHLFLLFSMSWRKLTQKEPFRVHATGTSSWVSDIVHIQFIHLAWARTEGRTQVSTCGWLRERYRSFELWINVFQERILYRNHRKYIAISEGVREDLQKLFHIRREQISVIRHGVDTEVFRPLKAEQKKKAGQALKGELGLREDCVLILFVGTPERKGLSAAIQALSLLNKQDVALLAVGVTESHFYRSLAKELGVEAFLRCLPPSQGILRYYQACDIFLLPTLYEPFGLVGMEAMACELSPVISRCAGVSELTVPGESAFWIQDALSPVEIHGYLKSLVEDSELRSRMGKAARKVAESRSWAQVTEEYVRFLS